MSYAQRMATFEQFTKILETSAKHKFRYAPAADQIDGLMEGVMVILTLQEMSVDYAEHVSSDEGRWQTYVPRHRVHASVLFDGFSTYEVDVLHGEWFALPSTAQWQASLPVIHVPSEVIDKILDETPEEPNETLRAAAKLAKECIRFGVPTEPEEGWDAVAEIRADRDEEDGGSGVTAPTPDPEPAPTTSAARRQPRKRAPKKVTTVTEAAQHVTEVSAGLNKRLADADTDGAAVPSEAPVG